MSSMPPLLANKDNVGDDGLMSQLTFDADIDNEVYLNHLYPNPNLVDDSTPPPAELLWNYTNIFNTLIVLRLKISRGKTLSSLRHPGELVNIKLADVSATDIMLDKDDAKFTDWCKHNQFARSWYCQNFNKSALLQLAIETCIKKSPNHQHATRFQLLDIEPKFLGFVTAEIDGSVIR